MERMDVVFKVIEKLEDEESINRGMALPSVALSKLPTEADVHDESPLSAQNAPLNPFLQTQLQALLTMTLTPPLEHWWDDEHKASEFEAGLFW